MIAISSQNIATAGKPSVMEIIWTDLCERDSLESHSWHKSILSSREQQRETGNQAPLDWEKAKEKIRYQVDGVSPTDPLATQLN